MGRRISDGLSARVAVPASTTITQGDFVYLDGILGLAVQGIITNSDGLVTSINGNTVPAGLHPAQIVLNIEAGEYETSQINTGDTFALGAKAYFDATNKRFTTTSAGNRFAGVVTAAKDADDVIWFLFMPNSAEVATALGTAKTFVTFVVPGTLTAGAAKVGGFKFNKTATVVKVKARVKTLPGATHALDLDVNNGADSLFTAAQSIASTDTAGAFKEFAPNASPAKNVFIAGDILSVDIDNAGDTAAADLEVVIEFDQSV